MLDFLFGKKQPARITIDGLEAALEARPKETVLGAALREGLRFPNDCRVGGCGTCKCRLVEGKVEERTDKAYVLSAEELRAGYILACQSVPKGTVRIAVDGLADATDERPVVNLRGRVAARRELTHDTAEITVALEGSLAYTAGQYARLSMPGLVDESRCYSFARAPRSTGGDSELVFFVREVPGGAMSPRLVRDDVVGNEVRVEGPFGDFRLRDAKGPLVAVAGGSGLAPILALLEDALAHKVSRPVVLLFGARTEADLYALDPIETLRFSWPAPFTFVPVLSHEREGSAWQGARGLVTEHLERHLDAGAQG